MKFTAAQIAALLSGVVEGDENVSVSNVAKIEEGKPETLSFLANVKYTPYLYETDASIVIVGKDFKAEKPVKATLIRVDDAYSAFAKLLEVYQQYTGNKSGISSQSFIGQEVVYGEELYLGAFAYVGDRVEMGNNVKVYPQVYIGDDCKIGDDCILYPGVKLYAGTVIGKGCVIHAGAVLGSDGFGFAPQSDNQYKKVPQIGQVILEDYVEIGANTTIDRATLGATVIRKGVKLDNLIQVAHNVEIGENTVMAAQTGISGSTKIGKSCMFGGQVGLAGHLNIADGVKLAAQSGVGTSIRKNDAVFMGSPAIPADEYKRVYMHTRRLERLMDRILQLEKQVSELQTSNNKM